MIQPTQQFKSLTCYTVIEINSLKKKEKKISLRLITEGSLVAWKQSALMATVTEL